MDDSVPRAFIFMKVGPHGGESLPEILCRKNCELEEAKKVFWSYSKTGPLHPTTQVQPFVERWIGELGCIEVLMEPIDASSKFGFAAGTAKRYSAKSSKEGCMDIPKGIHTGAPEHALVLGKIRNCDLELDLRDFMVGIGEGARKGTNATQYLAFKGMQMQKQTGRQNKGCLVKASSRYGGPDAPKAKVLIKYRAQLLPPYAVFTFPDKA